MPRSTPGVSAGVGSSTGGLRRHLGYQELLEILDDPAHEEHQDRPEWLGIDRPDQHDPAHFDTDEVNDAFTSVLLNSRHRK
nr:hypothetical protein [Mycobacterium riyadhense]